MAAAQWFVCGFAVAMLVTTLTATTPELAKQNLYKWWMLIASNEAGGER